MISGRENEGEVTCVCWARDRAPGNNRVSITAIMESDKCVCASGCTASGAVRLERDYITAPLCIVSGRKENSAGVDRDSYAIGYGRIR